MSKKELFVLLFFLVTAGSFLSYYYVINSGARNLEKEKSAYTVSAIKISEDFSTSAVVSNKKYLNKAIEITGKVSAIDKDIIILDGKISCQFQVMVPVILNATVSIKGRVTGYDDLLEEVKLDQCILVK